MTPDVYVVRSLCSKIQELDNAHTYLDRRNVSRLTAGIDRPLYLAERLALMFDELPRPLEEEAEIQREENAFQKAIREQLDDRS